jgi:hypothetical protein
MRFNVGDAVKCIVSTGWESGKVLKTWDDGNAYRVKLDKGPEVRPMNEGLGYGLFILKRH